MAHCRSSMPTTASAGRGRRSIRSLRVFPSLPADDQKRVTIYCSNYTAKASAINFLGRGLPNVISGHNSYWMWGPGVRRAS